MSEKQINILVVEDDADIRHLIDLNLKKDGYCVYSASDGISAVQVFKNNDIDLVILDIMLPKMNGYDVIDEIRKFSVVPIIFLSAKTNELDKVRGLSLGSDDYITKPFSMTELLFRVKSHLRRYLEYSATLKSDIITNGHITLDANKFEVMVKNKLIDLSAKDFKILKLLMENLNIIFTKQQIYEQVWENEFLDDSNTVMVHISSLRSKIEENSRAPKYIKTIKGLGYKMAEVKE